MQAPIRKREESAMRVYLASAKTHHELDDFIASAVEAQGHTCVRPPRHPDERQGAAVRARANADAICRSDVVVLVGPDIDTDVAWRSGYARALGKRIVLLCTRYETTCDHGHFADEIAGIETLDDVPDVVAGVLARATAHGGGRDPLERAAPWTTTHCAAHTV